MNEDRRKSSAEHPQAHAAIRPGRSPGRTEDRFPGGGRREFAAAAVAGGLAVLGAVQRVHAVQALDDPDVVKELLQEIKDLACDVAAFVTGLPGPLTDQADKDYVEGQIIVAATDGEKLLNKKTSLLFSPPERWLFWMPVTTAGLNLTQIADEVCEAACDALDAWCDLIDNGTAGKDEEAAKALWQTQNLYCHLFEAAGIV